MPEITPRTPLPTLILVIASSFLAATAAHGAAPDSTKGQFCFKDANGKTQSIPVVSKYYPKKIEHPLTKGDAALDPKLTRAATIAQERAHAHSRARCWQYVKQALLATETADKFDILINTAGGGPTGQAGAAKLGIARALLEFNLELRGKLKELGFALVGDNTKTSPAVISIALPQELHSLKIGALIQESGYLLSYNSEYLRHRNWIQICFMGECAREKLVSLVNALNRACFRRQASLSEPAAEAAPMTE